MGIEAQERLQELLAVNAYQVELIKELRGKVLLLEKNLSLLEEQRQKEIRQLYSLIKQKNRELYGHLNRVAERQSKVESMLCRVVDELDDPMSYSWCDEPEDDRKLLESLRDDVLALIKELGIIEDNDDIEE